MRISDKIYDALKSIVLIYLPFLTVLSSHLHWDAAVVVLVVLIIAVGAFLKRCSILYNRDRKEACGEPCPEPYMAEPWGVKIKWLLIMITPILATAYYILSILMDLGIRHEVVSGLFAISTFVGILIATQNSFSRTTR